jgi:hypothetical protein
MSTGDFCFLCYVIVTFTAALTMNAMMINYLIQHARLELTKCTIIKATKSECSPDWNHCPYDVIFRGRVCGQIKEIHYQIPEDDFLRLRWHTGTQLICFGDPQSCRLFLDNKPPSSFFFAWFFYNFLALLIIMPIYWTLRNLYSI